MRIQGFGRLKRRFSRLKHVFQSRSVILVYHRVTEVPSDPQLLCVTPQHFAEHLEHLCHYYEPLSLQALNSALYTGSIPNKGVVITFDDGYVDNFWNAKPVLECYDFPATIFVTTGYVGQNREFWWDELERLLLLPERLPNSLNLIINDKTYVWCFGDGAMGRAPENYRQWNVTSKKCPTDRHEVYKTLHKLLRKVDEVERQQVLDELARWAGVLGTKRPDYRALNPGELRVLAKDELVEIGSHTITHPILAALPLEARCREIEDSKRQLEAILGRKVTSFSYSYGNQQDVGEGLIGLVQEAGYEVACANFASPVTRQSNPYWLPRYLVRDWDGEEFVTRLRRFYDAA